MYIDTDDEIEAPARHDELLSGEVCPGARGAFCIGPLDLAWAVWPAARRHAPADPAARRAPRF